MAATHYPPLSREIPTEASQDVEYDAIIIGGGMGGLTTAARLVARGVSVLVLEKYLTPGGSAGHFKREGYTFDVGSSMMFGFGDRGETNLVTKALATVGKHVATVPDPTQVHYHLPKSPRHPKGLNIRVWREYDEFLTELTARFPHERDGIRRFYDECWTIFRALNSMELKSLEEPRYLAGQLLRHPLECLTLARYSTTNTGELARKYIRDPELLHFLDIETYVFSTVPAARTPAITSGMVLSDRHYGGIRYPVGGVGRISEELARGVQEHGGRVIYKANVKRILTARGEGDDVRGGGRLRERGGGGGAAGGGGGGLAGEVPRACGVELADGRVFRSKVVISNATRWDTFEGLLQLTGPALPKPEVGFRERFVKSPSFLSLHMGVRAEVLKGQVDCHHIVLDDWADMEAGRGTIFVSLPSLLDPSLAPPGRHVVHAFSPDWLANWQDLSPAEYEAHKEATSVELLRRLERVFPGLGDAVVFKEVGTPKTHRRFLNRVDGTYGPIPSRPPLGVLTLPLNTTAVPGLYCVGDSTFPGQGVNAVVFSGFACAHRVLCDLGKEPSWPVADSALRSVLDFLRQLS